MLDEISAALARIEDKSSFATRSNCPSDNLCLEIGGVGPIRFPVSAASARKLCNVARPAASGRETRTLFQQEAERRTRQRTLLRALAKLRRRFTAT